MVNSEVPLNTKGPVGSLAWPGECAQPWFHADVGTVGIYGSGAALSEHLAALLHSWG